MDNLLCTVGFYSGVLGHNRIRMGYSLGMDMSFRFAPAVRSRVSLLIALAGASGSGKTMSALKIARGLAGGDDAKIAVIDTEAGRALHYACATDEKPSAERFAFMHGDFQAPFSPENYAAAVNSADKQGFEVIVIDSVSHEWESEGGLHDIHDALVNAAVEKAGAVAAQKGWHFDELTARDRASLGAWNEPKARHKRFVTRLLQCRAHLILCLRADEKIRIEKHRDERGRERTVIVQAKDMAPQERWVPICEKRFMYEMTLSLLLTPQNPGIPIPVKLQEQHRHAVPLDKHLSEQSGEMLARWASGDSSSGTAPQASASATPSHPPVEVDAPSDALTDVLLRYDTELAEAAERGVTALKEAYANIPAEYEPMLRSAVNRRHKARAMAADQGLADKLVGESASATAPIDSATITAPKEV